MGRILENSAWRKADRLGVKCAVVNIWLGANGILERDCAIIGLNWHVLRAGDDSARLRQVRRQLAATPRADGLGGYSAFGGVETKVALLRHVRAAGLLI